MDRDIIYVKGHSEKSLVPKILCRPKGSAVLFRDEYRDALSQYGEGVGGGRGIHPPPQLYPSLGTTVQ